MTDDINDQTVAPSEGPSLVPAMPAETSPVHKFDARAHGEARQDYTNWADKYCPVTLDDAMIPEPLKTTLKKNAATGEIPPIMLTGKGGIGKTAILTALLKDAGLDLNVINCGVERGINMVRDLKVITENRTVFQDRRGILLDELDGATADAQSAFRGDTIVGKSDVAIFVATANRPEKLTDMVRNRFKEIDFEKAINDDRDRLLAEHIERAVDILEAEGVQYDLTEVKSIVEDHFPSARGWMHELQNRAAGGVIKAKDVLPPVKKLGRSKAFGASAVPTGLAANDATASSESSNLLDDIAKHIARFIATSAENIDAITLFVAHAHAHEAASHSPLLWLSSPEKRCGKSTALDSIARLVPEPIKTSNISVAGMLRAIGTQKHTFLVDEMEHALKANGALHGILNLGHAPKGVMVRADGVYSTWAPKVVALIGALPGTLADRSIRIALRRRLPDETVERLSPKSDAEAEALRARCESWSNDDLLESLQRADPSMPESLDDRAQDNWRPLIAIADIAGGNWPSKARAAALALSVYEDIDEPSAGLILLGEARDWFAEKPDLHIASRKFGELARAVGAVRGTPKSCMIQVARILSMFNVRRTTYREGGKTQKGYERVQIEDAITRYLPDEYDEAA